MSVFKKYFTFRKKDRIGFFILMLIVVILLFIDIAIPKLKHKTQQFDNKEFAVQIDSFEKSLKPIKREYVSKLDSYIIARYDTLNLFKFNPNKTTDKQWKELGLTDKQIRTINNYKSRGGKFFIKDDFRKIYGIRTKQFHILEPFIDLPEDFGGENNSVKKIKETELFNFDPNTASKADLEKLGFTTKQVSNILNYRKKGGKFFKAEDLKKIYTISENDYQKYASYIQINSTTATKINEKNPQIIKLNTADSVELVNLPGIYPYLARKIIKYRHRLGGFYSADQLLEVYGFNEKIYNQIKKYLTIDATKIKKLNINFVEYKTIIYHPYIDKKKASNIINYRERHGFYTSVKQLVDIGILTDEEYQKLKYYLTVE